MTGWDVVRTRAAISERAAVLNGDAGQQSVLDGHDAQADGNEPQKVAVTTIESLKPGAKPRTVVLFNIDSALRAPGLSPDSYALRVLVSAAEAAGIGGTLVVCTSDPDQSLLQEVCRQRNTLVTGKRLWAEAREAGLPPFGHVVTIHSGRELAPSVRGWPGRVHGPKRVGAEWEIVVIVTPEELDQLRGKLVSLRRRGKVRLRIE